MQALSSVSNTLLLNRKDEAAGHSTRPETTGPASTFASYAFGPMDMPDDDKAVAKAKPTHGKAVTGSSSVTSTLSSSAAFLTQLSAS